MKTILKLSLIVLITMVSMKTYANNDDFLLHVKKGEGKDISFSVNDIQKASVTIYGKYHDVIYNETVTGKVGIKRVYNLSEFPDGVYYLEVETNMKKVTHEIVVTNEAIILSRKSIAAVYKGELKIKSQNVAEAN
ncbi:secretion protein [Flavobacterium sp. WC2509]|uniref:secretion protein n=1 Tax=Flavobacterium sp. WC2509 TaxID=3461406 RepID=UPI004043E020